MILIGAVSGKVDVDPKDICISVTGTFNLVIKEGQGNGLSYKIKGPAGVLGCMSVRRRFSNALEIDDGQGASQVQVAGSGRNVAVSVRGSGAVAVGAGAVAVGAGGVRIGGDNTAVINAGRSAGVSIGGRNTGTINTGGKAFVGGRIIVNGVNVTELNRASEEGANIPTLTLKMPAGASPFLRLSGRTTIRSEVPLGDVLIESNGVCEITSLSAKDLEISGHGPFLGNAEVTGGKLSFHPDAKASGTDFRVSGSFSEVSAKLALCTKLTTNGPVAGEYHVTAPDYSTLTHTGPISGKKTDSVSPSARVSFS